MFEHDTTVIYMHENKRTIRHTFNTLNGLGVEGIIFDYGATLDTNGNHWGQVIWHAYQKGSVHVSEADFTFDAVLSTKLQMQLAYLRDVKALDVPQLELDIMQDILLSELASDLKKVIDHSRLVLEELHGHYPLVLVSNFYGNIEAVLNDYLMRDLFKSVIESSVVGVRKPDPKIFALGVEALNLPAEKVLVVGDSFDKDIVPAHSLGCVTAWFKGEAWEEKHHDESLTRLIIKDLEDLLD